MWHEGRRLLARWWTRDIAMLLLVVGLLIGLSFLLQNLPIPGMAYYFRIIILIGINIILAVSLNIINGHAGQFSLGHAGFMAIGAYVSAFITYFYAGPYVASLPDGSNRWIMQNLLFLAALLAGGAAGAIAGYLVGLPSLRLRGDYLAIVTLGFGEIIRVIFLNIDKLGAARGLSGVPPWGNFFWVFFFAWMTILVSMRLVKSAIGRAFLAVREDEIAAEAMGVDTTHYKVQAFVIGSFFAAVAGGLYGHYLSYLNPSMFTFIKSFEVITMVVLGGMGSISGSVLAAIILTFMPEGLRMVKQWTNMTSDPRMVIYAVMLIVLMLTRPQGLLGRRELWDVLARRKDTLPRGAAGRRTGKDGPGIRPADLRMKRENPDAPLLEAKDVTIRFGGLTAVADFNLTLDKHELAGLIGPNGAGKTTIFNMLTGVYQPTEGAIRIQGAPIANLKPHSITELGVARTFQNIRLFKELSVLDNVKIGGHKHYAYSWPTAVLHTNEFALVEKTAEEQAMSLLRILGLEHRAEQYARNLAYGDQRRLEIARALGARPRLLLLDEPAAGLNTGETIQLMDKIHEIRDRFDLTILVIEHNMELVMGICQRILVLNYGKTIAQGTPQQIQDDPVVIEAYLGEPASVD